MLKIRTTAIALASATVAVSLVLLPSVGANAHGGLSSNYSSKALCEEDRRQLARTGHVTTPCDQLTNGSWYFFYTH